MICARCRAAFAPRKPWQRYCSTRCQGAAKDDRKPRMGRWRWRRKAEAPS